MLKRFWHELANPSEGTKRIFAISLVYILFFGFIGFIMVRGLADRGYDVPLFKSFETLHKETLQTLRNSAEQTGN